MSRTKEKSTKIIISEEFKKIVIDLMDDLLKTFPEFIDNVKVWWTDTKKNFDIIFKHCQKEYPVYFFDILYKNKEAFETSEFEIVPNIKLKDILYSSNISEHTYEIIWKYLQLLLFSIINTIQDKNAFGDNTKNLFSAISPEVMQEKLEEVMENFKELFNNNDNDDINNMFSNQDNEAASDKENTQDQSNNFIPNLDDIQEHLNKLMEGKIGQFAMEMAEDWIRDFDFENENENISSTAFFEKILKDPSKLMSLMQKLFNKFQEKINSGEMTQEEIIKEAKSMLEKLKGIKIPGMEKMMSMLSLLTQKKRNKANTAAAFSNFSQMQKSMEFEKIKEKLLASKNKLNAQKNIQKEKSSQSSQSSTKMPTPTGLSDDDLIKLFETSQSSNKQKKSSKPHNKK